MKTDLTEISRKLGSLLLLCWEAADAGELDTSVIADGLDITNSLFDELMDAVKGGAAE